MKIKKKTIFIALVITLMGVGLDHRLSVVNYKIEDARIQQPVRIALVADLHSCNYGKNQQNLTQVIEESKPDIVLLAGDIVDDSMPEKKAWEFFDWLQGRYPSYYVTGNHEYWIDDVERVKQKIGEYQVDVLEGEKREIEIRGQRIDIFGVDDPLVGETQWQNQMRLIRSQIQPEVFSVLVTHRPERYEQYRDFSLSVAGHAHGGQWRIPGLLNGLLAPNQGLFPKYAGGLYEFEKYTMIVSRGLARESTRIPRFYNRPEYVVIDLVPSEERR